MASYTLYDDGELLRLLLQSDEKAFSEIYNRYWKRLFGVAWYHLHSKEVAEDIVQEVLASIWQRREQLAVQSLENYLATAVKYAVFRTISKENRRAVENIPALSIEYSLADFYLLKEQVQKEVNRLPETSRVIFEYSRGKGLANKEIAQELQVSEKTVEKHITRALRILKTQLRVFFLFF